MTDPTTPRAERPRAHPPETTEGWYALHQVFAWNRPALRAIPDAALSTQKSQAEKTLASLAAPAHGGWSAVVPLIGNRSEVMLVHFRPTLDEIGAAQRELTRLALFDLLTPTYSFLSVTEAGLYHASAQLAASATARGGSVGDEAYRAEMDKRVAGERANAHVQRRLFPVQPPEMPYVCFYPMSKRRVPGKTGTPSPSRSAAA